MLDLRTTLRLLRLLLSQHNLQITGLHEQMIEQLGSISPSKSSATGTRNVDASASATKRLRPKRQEPAESDVYYESPTTEDELPRYKSLSGNSKKPAY